MATSVIRIVSSSGGWNKKLDPIFIELVRKEDKERGFTMIDLYDAIEDKQGSKTLTLTRVSSSLVKAYAKHEMFDQAIDLFFYLRCAPDVKALNFLMNCMIDSGRTDMALSCFRQFLNLGWELNSLTYRKVVRCLCDDMKIDAAEKVVIDMERRGGIDPDVYVYLPIIEAHRKNMDFDKALRFFSDNVKKINVEFASSVLQCYIQLGQLSEAYELFEVFREMNVFAIDRVCYNVAFNALGKLGRVEEAIKVFKEMATDKGITPDIVNYTTLIGGCFLIGDETLARDLFIEMERICGTTKVDGFAYSVIAGGLATNDQPDKAFNTLCIMQDRGVKPTSFTYSMVIQGLFVSGNTYKAQAFYYRFEDNNRSWDNTDLRMLKGYCEAGRLDKAFELFKKKESSSLPKNVYVTLFTRLCGNDDYIANAQYLVERMSKLGVEPEKKMLLKLIGAWYRVKEFREARRIFEVLMLNRKMVPDLFTYTIMIDVYCKLKERKEGYVLFKEMKRSGIVPDVKTYTVLLKHFPELDMKKEMKELGVERDICYYTVLIDQHCKLGDLEEAER